MAEKKRLTKEEKEQIAKATSKAKPKATKSKPAKVEEEKVPTKEVEPEMAIDIETDEEKSLFYLMEQGKIAKTPKGERFILAHDVPFSAVELAESGESPKYKVYVKDIETIKVEMVYDDLVCVNPSIMKTIVTVKHSGRRTFDRITAKQVKELLAKGDIDKSQIYYVHVDFSRRLRIMTSSSKRPHPDAVIKYYEQRIEDFKTQYGHLPGKLKTKPRQFSEENEDDINTDDSIEDNDKDNGEDLLYPEEDKSEADDIEQEDTSSEEENSSDDIEVGENTIQNEAESNENSDEDIENEDCEID